MKKDERICTFDDATHTYYLDGVKMISVTQLLTEQNIKSDFSKIAVNAQDLAYATMKGNAHHEEIENFIKYGIEGVSDEFKFFKEEVFPLRDKWYSEVIIYCDDYCGRCDAIGISEGKPAWVSDIKTGSSWTKTEVSWQTSLYARCLSDLVGDDAEMKCIDLHNFDLVDVDRISEKEIKKLIKCHKNGGEKYQEPQLIIPSSQVGKLIAFETAVTELEETVKALTEKRDEMREKIRQMFVAQGVKNFDSPTLKITYVAPSKRAGSVDKELLKKKFRHAYNACLQPDIAVKDSIRVKVRSAE